MSTCPYQNVMKNFSLFGGNQKKVEDSSEKCPYADKNQKKEEVINENKKDEAEKKDEISSDEDEKPSGGCPVMNKSNQFD